VDFDIGAFIEEFPEFADTTLYPTAQIEFWVGFATLQVRQEIWKKAWSTGVSLYVAHQLVLYAQNRRSAAVGGIPGQSGGIANNKTVGSATVAYDTASTSLTDAGFWNLTNYGKQFFQLVKIFGAGVRQL